jgi:hypothetical protein
MNTLRARDVRAIVFCIATIALVAVVASRSLDTWPPAAALTSAYAIWLVTRPRMLRIVRRLGGQRIERSRYYIN